MKKIKYTSLVVFLILVLSVSAAFAQRERGWQGSGGWGMGTQYQRIYNPATVETVTGIVEAIDRIIPFKGMRYGIHIMLKTEKESISVHLGPAWYIESQDVRIEKGDKLQIKGSRVKFAERDAIVAAEIIKGDHSLILRDSAGTPNWAGWRRR